MTHYRAQTQLISLPNSLITITYVNDMDHVCCHIAYCSESKI